jgi:UPF0716 protein FxsA
VGQDFEPMQLVKWIATGLLVLPVAELAAFILVASQVGFVTALGLLILISLAGVLVLRHAGAGAVTRLRAAAGHSHIRGIALDGPATGTALGGILMVIPGFITGVLGLLVILPATRNWLADTMLRYFTERPRTPPPGTIDLAPEEWRPLPDSELPPPRRGRRTPQDRDPG